MPGVIGMTGNVTVRLHKGVISCLKATKRELSLPMIICLMLKTNEAWARRQRRDKQEKHVELLLDAQLFQAAA